MIKAKNLNKKKIEKWKAKENKQKMKNKNKMIKRTKIKKGSFLIKSQIFPLFLTVFCFLFYVLFQLLAFIFQKFFI